MRTHEHRRHDRHDAESADCPRPDEDRRHGDDHHHDHDHHHDDRRPRGDRGDRGGRGDARDGFPGGFPGGPAGFRGPGPWTEGARMRGPGGRGGPRMRGSRAQRGDARAAALALLGEKPMNGYQIIQEIGERSGGLWQPSPGSVYPALQQLQDEGLIQAEPGETGHRGYVLTDSGREYAAAHPDELRAPWDTVTGGTRGAAIEMRNLTGQLAMAAWQVTGAGTDAQQAQARKILTDTRKALYQILADSEDQASAE
jgi:DNA-binding PadR family transcriptional regulator